VEIRCLVAFLLSLIPLSPTRDQSTSQATYVVTISASDPLRARVDARFDTSNGALVMAKGGGIDHLPNQWATFVEGLHVADASGRPLTIESNGPDGWKILGGSSGQVRLQYTVNLDFTTKPWPPGNEQAGLSKPGALYMVTKPLFVASDTDTPARIEFRLPAGWHVSTPWEPVGSSGTVFTARNRTDLIDNSVVWGTHRSVEFHEGNFTLVLAFVGPEGEAVRLVEETLRAAVRQVGRVFNQTPPSRFMMTLLYTPEDDGESFERSTAVATATVPREDNRMLWGNNLAHELYHIWIGGQIAGGDGTFEWFDEGFTDYYADLALVRSGLIDRVTFLRKMEKVMARYAYFTTASVFERLSMAEASRAKGRNRFGVYDAGWSTAFCLDVTIRRNTNGQRTLDDFMRLLYARYGLTNLRFSAVDFVQAATEIAGQNLEPFFNDHVFGKQPLPLRECLLSAGLEGAFQPYAAELWISPDPKATPAAKDLFDQLVRVSPQSH
jgi:predicted metalloprotease with PDZ domain